MSIKKKIRGVENKKKGGGTKSRSRTFWKGTKNPFERLLVVKDSTIPKHLSGEPNSSVPGQ